LLRPIPIPIPVPELELIFAFALEPIPEPIVVLVINRFKPILASPSGLTLGSILTPIPMCPVSSVPSVKGERVR
jgi:hypothetical protein